jgi:hypothetical protein
MAEPKLTTKSRRPRGPDYTHEEVTLCAYAALFDERDFGGFEPIRRISNRPLQSVKDKVLNIAAMLDEEGIPRQKKVATLSGLPTGRKGRRTNWNWVQPLALLPQNQLLDLCRRIVNHGGTPPSEGEGADVPDMGAFEDKLYEPHDEDDRAIVTRQIAERRGQPAFRDMLFRWYRGQCLVTGSKSAALLEAAHICPYRREGDNHPANGLLLRTDIHTLFDLDLLGIEPKTLRTELHPEVANEYALFAGRTLACSTGVRPAEQALEKRYSSFKQKRGH